VSSIDNGDPGLKIHQDAWIYRTTLEAGNSITHNLHSKHHGAYVFVIEGKVNVEGQPLNKRDALGISETNAFEIKADVTSDVIIFEVPMN
jgi:quercetin 2,3-dioxygenase